MVAGVLTSPILSVQTAPRWTQDVDDGAFVAAPLLGGFSGVVGANSLQNNLPVTQAARSLAGGLSNSWFDEYYHRVHITPDAVDLGNVVSTQAFSVTLWNAHLGPQNLAAISGLDEGVLLSNQPDPPFDFAGLQERTWTVSVTPDGQPVLDSSIVWQFANGELPDLRITATRIIGWGFLPDWRNGIRESLKWKTDILRSESMVEQRRALRTTPRRHFSAAVMAEERDRQRMDMALFGWGARIWAMPIWADSQRLLGALPMDSEFIGCATEYLDFVDGGLALLQGETAAEIEVVEIDAVTAGGLTLKRGTQQNWEAGAMLYPAKPAQLVTPPEFSRRSDQVWRADIEMQVMASNSWTELAPGALPDYRGWPVLDELPTEDEPLQAGFQRVITQLDNGMALPLRFDVALLAMPALGFRQILDGRESRARWRSFLYYLRGAQRAVWVPTHSDDLRLVVPVPSGATTIDVQNIGYTRFALNRPGRRDIRIQLRNGLILYRHIGGAAEITSELERLSLDAALDQAETVEPADIVRISWMALCRSGSDEMEIHHLTDSEGVARASLMFQGVRDDDV